MLEIVVRLKVWRSPADRDGEGSIDSPITVHKSLLLASTSHDGLEILAESRDTFQDLGCWIDSDRCRKL